VLEDDHDVSVSSIHYLRVFVSLDLGQIENAKVKLNEIGRRVYGEWASLAIRYNQVTLDAFSVLPNLVHGILCIDLRRQKLLEIDHPWSQNIRYTLTDIAKGFIRALRKKRDRERGSLGTRDRYLFSPIPDQLSLERFRTLIWEAPRQWDSAKKQIVASKWPILSEARVEPGIEASCPYCNPVVRPKKNKSRYCDRHHVFVDVPADPATPITYTSFADWLKEHPNIQALYSKAYKAMQKS
jgi:hypothetical protein